MCLYDSIADRSFSIDDWSFERRHLDTSSDFTRVTTVHSLAGDGEVGRGEDVTYDPDEHDVFYDADLDFELEGEWTIDEFAAHLDALDLFPVGEPNRPDFRKYRRWGFESAALDLALRQSETTFASAFDRDADPVRFVVSMRLGDPPTATRIREWLAIDPALEFKLDATPAWTAELVDELASIDRVRIVDLKGQYERVSDDDDFVQDADADLYRLVRDGLPNVLIEDPKLTDETTSLFADCSERLTWDAPLTDVESIRALPYEPAYINVKPSRFGTLETLFDVIEYCLENGIEMYGGGQFELDVGREQIQTLASVFYPDTPNDVAPGGYNRPDITSGLPSNPLVPPSSKPGFAC